MLVQQACAELGALASSESGVDMDLKTEASLRHARTLLAAKEFSQVLFRHQYNDRQLLDSAEFLQFRMWYCCKLLIDFQNACSDGMIIIVCVDEKDCRV